MARSSLKPFVVPAQAGTHTPDALQTHYGFPPARE
jgi:hypothetical protein